MEFKKEIPKYNCIKEVPNYYLFMEHGQPELCSFLINFFEALSNFFAVLSISNSFILSNSFAFVKNFFQVF